VGRNPSPAPVAALRYSLSRLLSVFKPERGGTDQPLYLVVNAMSHAYVRSTVAWMHWRLQDYATARGAAKVELRVQDRVDECDFLPNALIFVIGDPFGPFVPQPDSTYVFVNFSLLYDLAPAGVTDPGARTWLENKAQAMRARAPYYQAVANFLPEQNELLARDLAGAGVRVYPFLVDVPDPVINPVMEPLMDPGSKSAANGITAEEPRWDLCVVGSRTARRTRFFAELRALGLSLSPDTADDLALAMRRSRIVLNVHAHQTLNTEYPRIVEALRHGCCLLTEPCVGLADLIPETHYVCATLEQMPEAILELLQNPEDRQRLGEGARHFMQTQYATLSQQHWQHLMEALP
jgi:glycosyltransferase involved in cell wall biosynthesis